MNLDNLPEVWAGGTDWLREGGQLEATYLNHQAEVVSGQELFPSDIVLISAFHQDHSSPTKAGIQRGVSGYYRKSWGLVLSRSPSEARPHLIQFVVLVPVMGPVVLSLTKESSGIWRLKKQ